MRHITSEERIHISAPKLFFNSYIFVDTDIGWELCEGKYLVVWPTPKAQANWIADDDETIFKVNMNNILAKYWLPIHSTNREDIYTFSTRYAYI